MALNTGPLDLESNALTTRPFLKKARKASSKKALALPNVLNKDISKCKNKSSTSQLLRVNRKTAILRNKYIMLCCQKCSDCLSKDNKSTKFPSQSNSSKRKT